MASQRTSSGYNNPAYCSQHDYAQIMTEVSPGVMNHAKATYISSVALDNCCFEEDEEIPLSTTVVRQQVRQLIREPPIGASATLKVCETNADCLPLRTTAIPISPKRTHPSGVVMDSPASGHRNKTIITSPRTPKKSRSIIATSTPRKSHAIETISPQRQKTVSPRRQQACGQKSTTISPLSTPRRAILPTSPTKPTVRNVKYTLPSQKSTPPHRSTAVISPIYTCANTSTLSARPLVPQKQGPFLATGVVSRKSPARIDTSPGLKASWIHIPTPYQTPPTCTITTAGGTLLLCGAVSIVLCLYMMSQVRTPLQASSYSDGHHIHCFLESSNARRRAHSPHPHILFLEDALQ